MFKGTTNRSLYFSQPGDNDTTFWAPLMEKAWAKAFGSYGSLNQDSVPIQTVLRGLSGAPVFTYDTISEDTFDKVVTIWDKYKAGYDAGFLMTTVFGDHMDIPTVNSCGLYRG
jgi:hypothetical protein